MSSFRGSLQFAKSFVKPIRAISFNLVFEPPNTTLRKILGIDSDSHEIVAKDNTRNDHEIEITLNESARKYVLLPLPRDKRSFFPGYKVNFKLSKDVGVLNAHVTASHVGTHLGDPNAGGHIRGGFGPWYAKHPELKAGNKIKVKALQPGSEYELTILK